jgi:hypothetical protein
MDFLIRFLPKEQQELLKLGQRIFGKLETPEQRRTLVQYGETMLADGRVTVGEWAKFGSKLGILRGSSQQPPTKKKTGRHAHQR